MTIKPDSQLASPIQFEVVIDRLEQHRRNLRQQQIKQRLHLKAPGQIDQQLVKDLRLLQLQVNLESEAEVAVLIDELKAWLKQAPVIHLTFSTPSSPAFQAAIVEWLHTHIDAGLLVVFQVDEQISAGFLLRTKNRLFDFSANQLLWHNRHKIGELVRHV